MPAFTRRRLIVASLLALVATIGTVFFYFRRPDLKVRSTGIAVGSRLEVVETEFGPPRLDMQRTRGGRLLVWVDHLWQLNVLFDVEGRVESVDVVPVDSFFRRAFGKIIPLPK